MATFEAAALSVLRGALKERRAPYWNGWITTYYVERDKNPIGYWLMVGMIVALVTIAPLAVFAS